MSTVDRVADPSERDLANRSATGEVQSAAGWLDDHFEACREPYARIVEAAALPEGGTVLDVGSGVGSFLPLIRDQIGAAGRLVAMDHDTENTRVGATREAASNADSVVGGVGSLPFADGAFDAVWCANVLQYFDDEMLGGVLDELIRVLRPGGMLAVKDSDMTGLRIHPADPLLGARLGEACATNPPIAPESIGSLRGRSLRRWLERAGLEEVTQQTYSIEYWSPLPPPARRLWSSWLPYLATLAEEHGVPEADLELWRELRDPDRAMAFVDRDDFYGCEMQVLAVGRRPQGSRA